MGIVNAGMLAVYEEIPKDLLELVEDVLLNRRPDSTERLLAYADGVKGEKGKTIVRDEEWRQRDGGIAAVSRAHQRNFRIYRYADVEEARQKV